MRNNFLLEITVESVAAASAAERGGADRIELCADLRCGGLTPAPEIMHNARSAVRLPIFAMVRPRAGNFVYTNGEISRMKSQMTQARALGMNGIVLGVLREDNTVDISLLKNLVEFAAPPHLSSRLRRNTRLVPRIGRCHLRRRNSNPHLGRRQQSTASSRHTRQTGPDCRRTHHHRARQWHPTGKLRRGPASTQRSRISLWPEQRPPLRLHRLRPLRSRRPRSRPTQIAHPVTRPFRGEIPDFFKVALDFMPALQKLSSVAFWSAVARHRFQAACPHVSHLLKHRRVPRNKNGARPSRPG